jgi:hypothetical protein
MSDHNYTIFAVSNRVPAEDYYCLDSFLKTTEGTNRLVVEGVGTRYQGLFDKPKFMYRAIKHGLIKTEYIIACDCWDLFFVKKPEAIIDVFKTFDTEIVFSSERTCFPADTKDDYDKLPYTSSYRYLNSGMIVGYTQSVLKLLEAMEVESVPDDYWDKDHMVHFNDQAFYLTYFLKQPVPMKLDYDQKISTTLHAVEMNELEFLEQGIRVKETGSFPCVIHANGSGKTNGLLQKSLKHMDLR